IAEDQHTCIAAEVYSWEDDEGLQVADINPHNNVSQENIFEMQMVSGSPWQERPFEFEVYNSYDREVQVEFEPYGLLPGTHVELDTPEPYLRGRTSRRIRGVLRWDAEVIPTPETQDPNAPFWRACDDSAVGVTYEAESD